MEVKNYVNIQLTQNEAKKMLSELEEIQGLNGNLW